MVKLGDICIINMGQSPDSATYNETGDGIPFFQGNADFGQLHPKVRIWCNSPTKIANQDDILISVRAPIGALNIASGRCCIGRGLAALTVDKHLCNQKYLWYALECKVDELNSKGTGSTFKAINKKILSETEIPLPTLDEQRRIAAVLDKVSGLIAKRREQLDKLDELVKARFMEMFGEENTNITAEDACAIIVDCPHSTPKYIGEDKIYPAIRTSEIKNGQIDWTSMLYVDVEEYKQRTKRLVPVAGDIVYAREGTYGDCVILPEQYKFCLGQRTMLFRPNYNVCTSEYLHQVLRSDAVKRQADESNAGSTVPHVNVADAKKFTFPLPSLEKQKVFSNFVVLTNKSKLTIQQSLDKLEVLKKALMQQYFGRGNDNG